MRKIPIDYASPGMINARTIYSSEGRVLLAAGVELNDYYLQRLSDLEIHSIYIRDEITSDLTIPEVVLEKTRVEATNNFRQIFNQMKTSCSLNTKAARQVVDQLLDEVLSNPNTLVHLTDIRAFDDYIFNHSVNVCILSLMTGVSMSLNTIQLRDLGVGALLHDIGKIDLPREILDKPGRLTQEEFEKVKRHTTNGFDILRQYTDISLLSSHVAFQHHERYDGTGYPRGLTISDIHEYARIVAVTNAYDAMLSDRSYRAPLLPCDAVRELTRGAYTQFDPQVVAALLENIAIYPVGSLVQLSSQEIGIVVDVNKHSLNKPVVRLVVDNSGRPVAESREIDLDKFHSVFISRVFSDQVSYSLLRELGEGKVLNLDPALLDRLEVKARHARKKTPRVLSGSGA
ncbi:MAG: HD-GYP domain-containing protein [Firmicutes bacterium]|nr:HD-GYP domain-containing protein [Bacillota bacterium]